MNRVAVHAVLLVVMLFVAFFSWTDEERADNDQTLVFMWQDNAADLASVTQRSGSRTLAVERRGSGNNTWLWAVLTDSAAPAPPAPPAAGDSMPPVQRTETQVTEFPVGEAGQNLFESLARPGAIRDLGEATEEKRALYGLSDTVSTVEIRLRNGSAHTLGVGVNAVGGSNRYVHDRERSRIYVVPAQLLAPLDMNGDLLRLTNLLGFAANDVGAATVRAGSSERTMHRRMQDSPPRPVWTAPGSDRGDQTFSNFMEQLDRFYVTRYLPAASADTLQAILRVDYRDEDGDAIGFFELFRTRGPDTPYYYIRTAKTVVLGEVYAPQAERVEQDLTTLFTGGAPVPTTD